MSKGNRPSWIRNSIVIGAGFFIFALFLSAVFDPKIRVLHVLQAIPYVTVIVMTRRNSAWAFGAGCFLAALWNYTNLFVTTFIAAGLHQFAAMFSTGRLPRPDLAIAVVAAGGHFLMILACLWGFLRTRPNSKQWLQFLAGGVLSIVYFIAIIFTTGPQYIPLVKRVFHLPQ